MRFDVELKKRIGEEIERLQDELSAGMAVKDYPQYQNYVGKLSALRKVVVDFYPEVETKLNTE